MSRRRAAAEEEIATVRSRSVFLQRQLVCVQKYQSAPIVGCNLGRSLPLPSWTARPLSGSMHTTSEMTPRPSVPDPRAPFPDLRLPISRFKPCRLLISLVPWLARSLARSVRRQERCNVIIVHVRSSVRSSARSLTHSLIVPYNAKADECGMKRERSPSWKSCPELRCMSLFFPRAGIQVSIPELVLDPMLPTVPRRAATSSLTDGSVW